MSRVINVSELQQVLLRQTGREAIIVCPPNGKQDLATLEIKGVTADSREVKPGALFFAIKGVALDGNNFISHAAANGAAAAVVIKTDGLSTLAAAANLPLLAVADVREALAFSAAHFFETPAQSLMNIGVTGTNGKTSVTWLIAELLALMGQGTAHIGTLGMRLLSAGGGAVKMLGSNHTTPDVVTLQSFLAQARSEGARAVSMEVSSHGLTQHRTTGIPWDAGVFMNLTRDHLDYHQTWENYAQAKLRFFAEELRSSVRAQRKVILNVQDPFSATIAQHLASSPEITIACFSPEPGLPADLYPVAVEQSAMGMRLTLRALKGDITVQTQLVGRYNIGNLTAALLTLMALDFPLEQLVQALPEVKPVPGRLELVLPVDIAVYVDYAHTPDALLRAHQSLRELRPRRLITVFGCGGNRDRGKRPLMGKIAAQNADYVIVTSDNPRSEDPQAIIAEIIPGLEEAGAVNGKEFEVQADRRVAISRAIELAKPGDAVLLAGKGHEEYQEIQGVKYPFSDQAHARQVLQGR